MTDVLEIPFPTLGHLADAWMARHCIIPDGWDRGRPFEQSRWQYMCTATFYRVREDAPPSARLGAQAFTFRKMLVVGPQKSGKGPWAASITALEACGPSQFIGWARRGDVYECADWGCPCGWSYGYAPGEPMGGRHPSPLIQLTAFSESQVDNVYGPLTEMVATDQLRTLLQVREGFIRIRGSSRGDKRDRIDVVTSQARSRLGQPISFALQDEAGLWTDGNGMQSVADTQDRGAAGMNGRTIATTNAPDPGENSMAQKIIEAQDDDVFVYWDQPPAELRFEDQDERRQILDYVYRDSPWVSVDTIMQLANSLAKRDPGQAERFFGNRMVRGKGRWFGDLAAWESKRADVAVPPKTAVALGFDGSQNDDWTAIRLSTLDLHHFTPTYVAGGVVRPCVWRPDEWGGRIPRAEVDAALEQLMARYRVVRAYFDPFFWETQIDAWAEKYGEKVVIEWRTNSPRRMHPALERYRRDVEDPEGKFTHDECPWTDQAIRNAVIRARAGDSYIIGKPEDHLKIDPAMSDVLAHEAACDALAAGLRAEPKQKIYSDAMFGFN